MGVPVILPRHIKRGAIVNDDPAVIDCEVARNLGDYLLEVDDIVLVRTGSPGRSARVRPGQEGSVMSAGLIRLRANDAILPAYLANALATTTIQDWIIRNSSGTTVPAITVRALGKLCLPIPPPEIQRKIAEALEAINEQVRAYQMLADQTDQIRSILSLRLFHLATG